MEPSYFLILPFDCDSPEFVLGFEVGTVWTGLAKGARHFIVHGTNAEMMLRIAEARGLSVRSKSMGLSEFMDVYFTES
jgi:hypothetical protein